MYSSLFVMGLAALAGDLPPAAPPAPMQVQAPASESFAELNSKLRLALDRANHAETLIIVEAMIAHPDLPAQPEQQRRALQALAGVLHMEMERPEVALPWLIAATEGPDAPFDFWF